jgi:hypothetical protein
MMFYEGQQSATSPLRYILELTPEELELEKVKKLIMQIIQITKRKETKNERSTKKTDRRL